MKRRNTNFSKSGGKHSKLALMVRDAIRRGERGRAFFQPGEKIGVAVSGGADSVALLRLLLELRDALGIVVSVVHLNHQLRGRAADSDERFVAKLAETYGIEFFAERANVAAKAKREKLNLEDAARRVRYKFFASLVEQAKVQRVATAHTADDQAETVLAHILRGSGLAGIGGIHAVSGDVVRPLLGIRRKALRVYLKDAKQTWREDATNRDTTKLRARIRKKLIPLLEKQFQPATVEHLATLAGFAREDDSFLQAAAESRCGIATKRTKANIVIPVHELLGPPSICRRMVRCIVKDTKARAGELGATQVAAVLEFAKSNENGRSLDLPGGLEVRRDRDVFVFRVKDVTNQNATRSPRLGADKSRAKEFEHEINLAEKEALVAVPCLARSFRFTVIDWPEKRVETSTNGSVLDHDALCNPLVLRNWRPGDTFQPLGHRKPHKLKRLLNEKRISRWERDGWPVLTSAGVIVWVRGFPVGAGFAATAEAASILRVEECAS
jgi:tRNA(Ile)-lysidine synthase